ncbi:hypothetical protein [Nonomuraea sp. NPDC049607]|uniref:hypothetical protein n=1 Tax=unclassified Nonomuraea TaxID=2593643 RepID=UPI00341C94EF
MTREISTLTVRDPTVSVECPADTAVSGGGASLDPYPPGAVLISSVPSGNGWSAAARNNLNAGTLHVYALCIPVTA